MLKTKKHKNLEKFLRDVKLQQEELEEKAVTRSQQSQSPTLNRNFSIDIIKRKSYSQSSQESQEKSVIVPQKVKDVRPDVKVMRQLTLK